MTWSKHIVPGSVLVLALCAGCDTIDANLSLFGDSKPAASKGPVREIALAGSVDAVAASTKSALEGVGLSAVVTNSGEAVRVSSASRKGQKFTLVLTHSTDGKTHARIEWEGSPDDETGTVVLAMLAAELH
jgi:hypothetical protein